MRPCQLHHPAGGSDRLAGCQRFWQEQHSQADLRAGDPLHGRILAGERPENLLCRSGYFQSAGEPFRPRTEQRHRGKPVPCHAGEAGCAEGADGKGYVEPERRAEEKGTAGKIHLRTGPPAHLGRADELYRRDLPDADRRIADSVPADDPVCGTRQGLLRKCSDGNCCALKKHAPRKITVEHETFLHQYYSTSSSRNTQVILCDTLTRAIFNRTKTEGLTKNHAYITINIQTKDRGCCLWLTILISMEHIFRFLQ